MAVNRSHGWTPYLAPYVAFLILVEIARRAPDSAAGAFLALKVAIPLGLFCWFFLKGSYPELRGERLSAGGVLADILLGLLVTGIWVAPYLLGWLSHPLGSEGFDAASIGGERFESLALGIRLLGFGLATPFIEELFVRSFLLRYLDVFDTGKDFRNVPIARFAWRSFIGTVIYFTFSHQRWEWAVAAATGIMYNLWLYKRKDLRGVILAHATTNISLFGFVVLASYGMFGESLRDLWYFL